MATPQYIMDSTSSFYEGGFSVSYVYTEPEYKTCLASVIPYFRRLQSNRNYVRRPWIMRVYLDDVLYEERAYTTKEKYLPDNNAYVGVEYSGELYMYADYWYRWGDIILVDIPNDGKYHTIAVQMHNPDSHIGTLITCPKSGVKNADAFKTESAYAIEYAPPAPKGLNPLFNEDTRILNYVWTPANCSYIRLYRQFWDRDGNCIKEGYFPDESYKIDNDDLLDIKEYVDKGVAKVTWTMTNYNTGAVRCPKTPDKVYETSADGPERIFKIDCVVFVNDDGTYRKAVPWVNDNGNWKKASNTFVNDNGTWKRTIM